MFSENVKAAIYSALLRILGDTQQIPSLIEIESILHDAKDAAVRYHRLTGKPLGITGELGEFYAAKYLDLDLAEARSAGCDAADKIGRLIQIKSRSIPTTKMSSGQRVGAIRLDHEWDVVVLVLMDELFEPYVMYEADRAAIKEALTRPGSKARNERGALAISKFKSIARQVWQTNSV